MAELPRRTIYAIRPFLFMKDMMGNLKSQVHSGIFIKKALAVILAGVFLFTNTFCWAKEEELFLTGMGNNASSSSPAILISFKPGPKNTA